MAHQPRPQKDWQYRVRTAGIVAGGALWLFLGLLGTLGMVPEAAAAEMGGSIQGVVQLHGQEIPEHRIMLIRFGPDGDVQRTPGQTDTKGQFVFDNLQTGEAFEYVVGIRYEGQLYRSDAVRLSAGQQHANIVVEIGTPEASATEQPQAQSPLRIVQHLMVLVLRNDHLEVREILRLLNSGATPYIGTAGHGMAYSLHIPLPYGYYNLHDIQGLASEHVHQQAAGLYYTAPLSAGEQQVIYTYSLPLAPQVTTLLIARVLPTMAFDVLVEDASLVASSDLQLVERVSIEPHTFWHFRGEGFDPHSRSWVQVTRRTEPAVWLRLGTYSLIIGLALFGLGIPFANIWRRRKPHEPAPAVTAEQLHALNTARVRLLQTVARLDDQYAAGGLAEPAYQQRRQALKTQLLTLAEQLYYAQGAKESRPQ